MMENRTEEPTKDPPAATPICLEELSRRLNRPCENVNDGTDEPLESMLSYIPWRFQATDGDESAASSSLPITLPSFSYLDLRRQQNTAWATGRLNEGNTVLFQNPPQAESFFKQGLDLVPDHVELLVAYGKLMAQTKRFTLAVTKFQRALELDPDHVAAKENLKRTLMMQQNLSREQSSSRNRASSLALARESAVYNDVLLERSFRQNSMSRMEEGDTIDDEDINGESVHNEVNLDSSSPKDRPKRKKKRKKRRRGHKKRSRHRSRSPSFDSSDDDDEDDVSDDSSSTSDRKHIKRKRRRPTPPDPLAVAMLEEDDDSSREYSKRNRKHRRKHASQDDSGSSSSDDSSHNDRRRRRHGKRRKHSSKSKRKKRKRRKDDDS